MRDPRSHRRYVTAAKAYIKAHAPGAPCVLCGRGIDTTLPGMSEWGPTIEHRIPIRVLRTRAVDDADLLAMACDQSTWALAHSSCQKRQGGKAASERPGQSFVSRW
jgi:hypothetical protein